MEIKVCENSHIRSKNDQNVDVISKNIWNDNASLWIELVSNGYDLYRDFVSFPGFLKILPDIRNLKGLDVGCAEGRNTRALADLGAKMTGIDICSEFIEHAIAQESKQKQGVQYSVSCASVLAFENECFDFVTAFVSLMDMKEVEKVILETLRVLKPGGFFQFSITHPCFWSGSMEWIFDKRGNKSALACKDYFDPDCENEFEEWVFDGVEHHQLKDRQYFKSYNLKRTLSEWVNMLTDVGYHIDKFHEPKPTSEAIQKYPAIAGSSIVPYFLIIRCSKT